MADFQRQAFEQAFRIGTNHAHQSQGLPVGADQDVLAVIERVLLDVDAACPAAELPGGLEYADRCTGSAQFNCCRQPGPATADDGDFVFQPLIHVRQAIHSLRSGVSEVRWVNTWQPSRLISSRTVR